MSQRTKRYLSWSILGCLLIAGAFLAGSLQQEPPQESPVLLQLQAETETTRSRIYSRNWASARSEATGLLSRWIAYPEFPEVAETVVEAYSHLPPSEVAAELSSIQENLAGRVDGIGWLLAALVAKALDRPLDADACLVEAINDRALENSPFPYLLRGQLLLKRQLLSAASEIFDYALALAVASGNPNLVLYIDLQSINALFDAGHVDLAVERARPLLASNFPIERAWALAQAIMYYWHLGDEAQMLAAYTQLKALLPTVTAQPDLGWQRRRLKQVEQALGLFEGALSHDAEKTMALDELIVEFDFKQEKFEAVSTRLRPWVEAYPIRNFASWTPLVKNSGAWAHFNYMAAEFLAGRADVAEAGLRALLANVPPAEDKRLAAESWCWLGYTLQVQRRPDEARQAFETGLALDVQESDIAGLPTDNLQPVVHKGQIEGKFRKAYVGAYRELLSRAIN